ESTPEELAKVVMKVHDMPKEKYEEMCKNAKIGAKNFDYTILTGKLIDVIEGMLELKLVVGSHIVHKG
ncbi:MAG TPA: hypothetical protein VIK78_19520, partial [Ruminiclostridium sp.]